MRRLLGCLLAGLQWGNREGRQWLGCRPLVIVLLGVVVW